MYTHFSYNFSYILAKIMAKNKKKFYKIQNKSIVLDIIERIKTKHRICDACPEINEEIYETMIGEKI